jgi:hypothetical protein
MAMRNEMADLRTRLSARRAERQMKGMDRQRERLEQEVGVLRAELAEERDARRDLASHLDGLKVTKGKRRVGLVRMLAIGGGAYVLGARAGRGRYEEIMRKGRELRESMSRAASEATGSEPVTIPDPLDSPTGRDV